MLLELLYDLLGEISPMYFYLGIIFTIICSMRIMNMDMHNTVMANHDYTKKCHAISIKLLPKHEPISQITEIHNWITHATKRIEAPDDKTLSHPFSFKSNQKRRGGQQWENMLYSLSARNIVL